MTNTSLPDPWKVPSPPTLKGSRRKPPKASATEACAQCREVQEKSASQVGQGWSPASSDVWMKGQALRGQTGASFVQSSSHKPMLSATFHGPDLGAGCWAHTSDREGECLIQAELCVTSNSYVEALTPSTLRT